MDKLLKQAPLAMTVKRVTMCAATTALLTTTSLVQSMEVKVGGFVKVDAIYDIDQDLGPSLDASVIDTTPGRPSTPNFQMNAMETRVNVTATQDKVKVFVEGDFYGGQGNELVSNSSHFRLRHAYGQVGNFLAGQTWSTFLDANWIDSPTTVDFLGPAGAVSTLRQTQFRWTVMEGLDLAIENPENQIEIGGEDQYRDTLPDFVARYATTGKISWQVAGLLQKFEVDGGANDGQSEINFGANAGINFATKSGSFSAAVIMNANRYSVYGDSNPLAVISGGNLEVIDSTAGVFGYNHDWGGKLQGKSTIAIGSIKFDDKYLAATDIDTIGTFHINYRWIPYNNVTFMGEVSHADKKLVNGNSNDDTRLQFAVQYDF
jgi:hypothetical protein